MKTAIAVPDATFNRVEHRAKALGMSRSEFYSRAAEHYLAELDREGLTARIDAAIAATAPLDEHDREWSLAGLAALAEGVESEAW